jgi:nicotinamide mononucleotide transporter
VYGWWAWRRGTGAAGDALPVSRWSARQHASGVGLLLVVALVNGWLVARSQGGVIPYVDALVAWVSVLATWMVARKVLENWLYWMVIDSVAAVLYWSQGFHATAVLFLVYVAIAVRGWFSWRADLARGHMAAVEHARA